MEQFFNTAWDRVVFAWDRVNNEGLLMFICLLLFQIIALLQSAAKQRYAIARIMSRGDRVE